MQPVQSHPLLATAWLMTALLVNATTADRCGHAAENPPPSAELAQLNADLARLQQAVQELSQQTASLTADVREAAFAGIDLRGSWQLTLPAGFEYPAEITAAPNGHLRLAVRGVMRGTYRHDGQMLRMMQPADERLTEFVWAFVGPDRLMLIKSPPVAKIGSDYTGATLTRVQRKPRN